MGEKCYICCDLKSFYASVECVERGLNPMTTNLVVADRRRTEKTICLAVSPSLKSYGIPGRARLFEVVQRVAEVNAQRKRKAPGSLSADTVFPAPAVLWQSFLHPFGFPGKQAGLHSPQHTAQRNNIMPSIVSFSN